jgi:hypothetical protein
MWPDAFIWIYLARSRAGLGHSIGEYGFCSVSCFSNWTTKNAKG